MNPDQLFISSTDNTEDNKLSSSRVHHLYSTSTAGPQFVNNGAFNLDGSTNTNFEVNTFSNTNQAKLNKPWEPF